jgi:hypothetical protein
MVNVFPTPAVLSAGSIERVTSVAAYELRRSRQRIRSGGVEFTMSFPKALTLKTERAP